MRLLHTADWHLADRLGRIDRTKDLHAAVERVAAFCREQDVDVLVIAGDLFSDLARPDSLHESISHFQQTFNEFLSNGGTILAITGNHDNDRFCDTLVQAMRLAAPLPAGAGQEVPGGRLYLATQPTVLQLRERHGPQRVQFVLMPYPKMSRYFTNQPPPEVRSWEDRRNVLCQRWADCLRRYRSEGILQPRLPAVLVAHLQLYGVELCGGRFRIPAEEDVVVALAEWPCWFDYVALGHVHKPQMVDQPHVRYSGSIERLDLGEQHDAKSVVLVEVGPQGLNGPPQLLPLPATPIYEVTITRPAEELPTLKQRYLDAERALVKLTVHYDSGRDSLEDLLKQLGSIFPRWYDRQWQDVQKLSPSTGDEEWRLERSVAATVRQYLQQELADSDPEERQAILQLAEEVLRAAGETDGGEVVN